jgi:serine/threonine-protein kinase
MRDPILRLSAALEGRYRVEREIGAGGMATVYVAEDVRHERRVALKVLRPELAAVVGAERFLAEIKTTANLQHPHILPLHDSGEAGGFLFYVMPYVEGETLRARLERERQLPVEEAVRIASDLAEALDYAHRHGVIHRDIKPANILLVEGRPVLADFGIALAVSAGGAGRLTETGLSLGTPHYMSPEQATGDLSVGPGADIYALGCVLYEMLVGEPPYTGSTPQAVLGRIITGQVPSAREHRSSVPSSVDAVVARSLEKVPADRFRSGGELAAALADEHFALGGGVGAGTGGGGPWRRVSAALAGAVILLTAAIAWPKPEPVSTVSLSRLEVGLPVGVEAAAGAGITVDIAPDGSTIVFVGDDVDGGRRLYLRSLDELTAMPLPGTEGGNSPRFSPDGQSVAFVAGNSLRTLRIDGGRVQTIASDASGGFTGIAWGEDGMIYVGGAGEAGGLGRVAEGGGQLAVLVAPERGDAYGWPALLPSAAGVLFRRSVSGGRYEIMVLSLETGDVRSLGEGAMARYAPSGHLLWTSADGMLLAAPFDLMRLEITGPARTLLEGVRVSASSASNFAISRTGTLLYLLEDGMAETRPVWLGRDGTEEELDPGLRRGRFESPAISPDGRRIAFAYVSPGGQRQAPDIWIYDLEQGGTFSPLTRGVSSDFMPFWSPDGREIAFTSDREGPPDLYIGPWDGSLPPRVLRSLPGETLWGGTWAPDGRLVYQRNLPPSQTALLSAAPHPDSAESVVLDSPFSEAAPSLSPDGRWLAYASDESGTNEVWVRPFPGPGGRWRVSLDGGMTPLWAGSGREIVFRGLDGAWLVATVRTEPDFAVESREVIASGAGYYQGNAFRQFDLSHDGQRILAIRNDVTEAGLRLVVVQGFLEELRTIVTD